jgi:hypothetical protein
LKFLIITAGFISLHLAVARRTDLSEIAAGLQPLPACPEEPGQAAPAPAFLYRIAHNWITDYYRRCPLPELAWEVDSCLNLARMDDGTRGRPATL